MMLERIFLRYLKKHLILYSHYLLCALLLCFMTHSDITMGQDVLGMLHCDITIRNVAKDIHCDITIDNDVSICTYHRITMDNDVAMNLFCYLLLEQIMILLFH